MATKAEERKAAEAEAEAPQETPEAPQAEVEGNGDGESTRKRARTIYAGSDELPMESLDELPENEPVGRSRLYFDLLTAVAEDGDNLGRWHVLARFGTANGAKAVAKSMNKQVATMAGELTGDKALPEDQFKDIPQYEGYRWEFDSRRVASEGTDPTKRDSILYVRLVEAS